MFTAIQSKTYKCFRPKLIFELFWACLELQIKFKFGSILSFYVWVRVGFETKLVGPFTTLVVNSFSSSKDMNFEQLRSDLE